MHLYQNASILGNLDFINVEVINEVTPQDLSVKRSTDGNQNWPWLACSFPWMNWMHKWLKSIALLIMGAPILKPIIGDTIAMWLITVTAWKWQPDKAGLAVGQLAFTIGYPAVTSKAADVDKSILCFYGCFKNQVLIKHLLCTVKYIWSIFCLQFLLFEYSANMESP